jgi:antitoxin component YwqK of YwqJK toxin-antitoxin module
MDKKSGLWREYTQKGDLYKETFYKDGKVHGINNSYSNDGKIEQKIGFPGGYLGLEAQKRCSRGVFYLDLEKN